jgi:glycosyltransferase involved in cell wall biosynthesis
METLSHSVLSTLDTLRRPYDIIQFHAIGSAPLAVVPRLLGRKTIVSVRGLDWQRAKWGHVARASLKFGEWASARCPSATAVVSETLQRHYSTQHGRHAEFIPNAVIPAPPVEPRLIRDLGLAHRDFILFAGRISPEKGVHTLLEAMRPFQGRIKIALAGGSSYSDGYIERVRSMAWNDVKFLGSVGRETMCELFSNCYAYVLPSVMEGLSISLLEALSYGACIITTDIPENLEVVDSTGLTFTPGDAGALQSALRRVLDDPAEAERLRARARERAASLPDWDEVARRTEDFYRRLLAGAATNGSNRVAEDPPDLRQTR